MATKLASLDMIILPELAQVEGKTAGTIDCDFDFFSKRLKRVNASLSLQVTDIATREANLSVVIFSDDGFILFAGGLTDATTTSIESVEKYDLITNVVSAGTSLSDAKRAAVGGGNTTQGIICGGLLDGGTTAQTFVDKYFYTTDAVAGKISELTTPRSGAAATAYQDEVIIAQGTDSESVTSIERYDLNTDTTEIIGNFLFEQSYRAALTSPSKAYFTGGGNENIDPLLRSDLIESYDYSTETLVTEQSLLSAPRWRHTATSNGEIGLIMGGDTGVQIDTVDRMDMATGVNAAFTTILTARSNAGADSTYYTGVIGGGGDEAAAPTLDTTEVFQYASLTFVVGTSLATARKSVATLSASPGVFFATGTPTRANLLDMLIQISDDLTVSMDMQVFTTEVLLANLDMNITT